MGDFQPDAHVNGSLGWSLMALMSIRRPAMMADVLLSMTWSLCVVFLLMTMLELVEKASLHNAVAAKSEFEVCSGLASPHEAEG